MEPSERRSSEEVLLVARDLALGLASARDLDEGLRLTLEAALRASGMEAGGIYGRDAASGELKLVQQRNVPEAFARGVARHDGNSVHARLVRRGLVLYAGHDELREAADSQGEMSEAARGVLGAGFRAIAMVPIRHEGEVHGSLNLATCRVDQVSAARRSALETIAAQAGILIDRLAAVEALRESEARQAQLLELSPVPLAILRGRRFFSLNRAFIEASGYTLADLDDLERVLPVVFPEEGTRRQAARWIDELLAEPGGRESVPELPVRCKDGSTRWVSSRAAKIGDILVVAFTDLTERRRLEQQLLQAQKMEAIGRLAGGVAHDFNNLLGVITLSSDAIDQELPAGHASREDLGEILTAVRRATNLTRQLLAFSRKQHATPQLLVLGELVAGLHKLLVRLIGEDIRVELEGTSAPWRVVADPGQLEQLLLNLAVNARDAMSRGGRLRIALSRRELDAAFADAQALVPAGRHVVLELSDTGSGMSDEVLAHVFEPFFSTKPVGQGTGLGLSTVYGIVQGAGGQIAVESRVGEGTTFRVYLPEAGTAEVPRADARASAPIADTTVLVVEDDRALRAIMERRLGGAGLRVLAPVDVPQALALAAGYPERIDLLITDVVMPLMNGRELADRVAASRPGMRVLFISGYPDEVLGRHDVVAGRVALLQKPFSEEALLRAIQRVLAS